MTLGECPTCGWFCCSITGTCCNGTGCDLSEYEACNYRLDISGQIDYDTRQDGPQCENCGHPRVLAKGRCKRCYEYRHRFHKERPLHLEPVAERRSTARKHAGTIDPTWARLTAERNRRKPA